MKNNTVFKVDDPYAFLTKELLSTEYIDNKLTDKQIAAKYNIGSKATVWRRRKFHKIANSTPTKSNKHALKNRKFSVNKDQILDWQFQGKTYDEMAAIVGCSRMVLYRRIKELGLVTECNQAMNNLKLNEKLTPSQTKFILGDLLGDGSITNYGMYQCNHSHKQKDFIEYKRHILSNLISPNFSLKESFVHNNQNGKTYKKYYLRTMANADLKKIYSKFYCDGVKLFPYKYLNKSCFDEYSLAAWYMGDGGRKFNIAALYTYGFGYQQNLDILSFLYGRFNIAGNLEEDCGKDRSFDKRHFISFKGIDASKFFNLVSPHLLPYFSYKLPKNT